MIVDQRLNDEEDVFAFPDVHVQSVVPTFEVVVCSVDPPPDIPHLRYRSNNPLDHELFDELTCLFVVRFIGDRTECRQNLVERQESKSNHLTDNIPKGLIFVLFHHPHRGNLLMIA